MFKLILHILWVFKSYLYCILAFLSQGKISNIDCHHICCSNYSHCKTFLVFWSHICRDFGTFLVSWGNILKYIIGPYSCELRLFKDSFGKLYKMRDRISKTQNPKNPVYPGKNGRQNRKFCQMFCNDQIVDAFYTIRVTR